jgi:hypothetical protein
MGAWGVGCSDVSPVTEISPRATVPIQIAISPNPFNPPIQIAFKLPVRQHVGLGVHDPSGCRLVNLVDDVLEAGPHDVIWNGRN